MELFLLLPTSRLFCLKPTLFALNLWTLLDFFGVSSLSLLVFLNKSGTAVKIVNISKQAHKKRVILSLKKYAISLRYGILGQVSKEQ